MKSYKFGKINFPRIETYNDLWTKLDHKIFRTKKLCDEKILSVSIKKKYALSHVVYEKNGDVDPYCIESRGSKFCSKTGKIMARGLVKFFNKNEKVLYAHPSEINYGIEQRKYT